MPAWASGMRSHSSKLERGPATVPYGYGVMTSTRMDADHRFRRRRGQTLAVRLSQAAESRANNFDTLRLFAAMLVLVSHAYALAGDTEPKIAGQSLGFVGVTIF